MLDAHVAAIRARYRAHRDAMAAALDRAHDRPRHVAAAGGRHVLLARARDGLDATALLPQAVEAGVAYVPGAPFFAQGRRPDTLRLSFVTVPPERIETGVATLARVFKTAAVR